MRTRRLIAGVVFAVGGLLLVLAGPASAQEGEESELSPETEECIHLAEEADDPDACQEAPNLILPATDELVWGAVSFTALFLLLRRFAYPPIKRGLEARTERIRADLQAAEAQREEAESLLAEYRAQLNDAKAESGRIIEEARQAADQVKAEQEVRLQAELSEMRARAVSEIDAAKAQAMADLRSEVVNLAIGAAETVVQRSLDAEIQTQLVEEYIDHVAAQRS
ncbi:MAG TPA: F0F1 ATP synthase subunit B [Acidimicrobiales bacterium]